MAGKKGASGRPKGASIHKTPLAKEMSQRGRVHGKAISAATMGDWLRMICDEMVTYPDLTGVIREMPAGKACALALVAKVLTERDVRAFEVLARFVDHGGEHKLAVSVDVFDSAAQEILKMAGYNVSEEGRIIETEFQEVREDRPAQLPIGQVKTPCEEDPVFIPRKPGETLKKVIPEVAVPALALVNAIDRRKRLDSKDFKTGGHSEPEDIDIFS